MLSQLSRYPASYQDISVEQDIPLHPMVIPATPGYPLGVGYPWSSSYPVYRKVIRV